MIAASSPVPKAERFTCEKCKLTAAAPIVRAVANPQHAAHGRCSNKRACDLRVLRTINRTKENSQ